MGNIQVKTLKALRITTLNCPQNLHHFLLTEFDCNFHVNCSVAVWNESNVEEQRKTLYTSFVKDENNLHGRRQDRKKNSK